MGIVILSSFTPNTHIPPNKGGVILVRNVVNWGKLVSWLCARLDFGGDFLRPSKQRYFL